MGHSHPAGHRQRRDGDSSDSGTTIIGDIWTLAGEGEASGEEGVSKLGKILPNHTIPSADKVLQWTCSLQTYREE
jgi:hypothetical protein